MDIKGGESNYWLHLALIMRSLTTTQEGCFDVFNAD